MMLGIGGSVHVILNPTMKLLGINGLILILCKFVPVKAIADGEGEMSFNLLTHQ
jgi:hypothetical protein